MHQNPTNNAQALQAIYTAGGHFVLAGSDKRPVWRSGQKLRPSLDLVQAHPGPLGLKPWSVSTSALDVDTGDPSLLLEDYPAMAVLLSRRPGGRHLYYRDNRPRGNGSFELLGCAGEIRSAKGFLILWGDGPAILADALGDPIARSRRWPVDLFDAAGVGPVTLPGAVKTPTYTYRPSEASRATWAAAAEAVELEKIQRGRRNIALFEAVRFWAYSVARGPDLDAWNRRVRVHALEANRRFPEPLPEGEAKQTAYSISTWCWSGGGARWHFDHSSVAQRRRGIKSGMVRRAAVAGRDAAILEAYNAGASMRAIAREWGIDHKAVAKALARVGTEPNQLGGWQARFAA